MTRKEAEEVIAAIRQIAGRLNEIAGKIEADAVHSSCTLKRLEQIAAGSIDLTGVCVHLWGSPDYLVVPRRSCFSGNYEVIGFRMRCWHCGKIQDSFSRKPEPDEEVTEVPSQPA